MKTSTFEKIVLNKMLAVQRNFLQDQIHNININWNANERNKLIGKISFVKHYFLIYNKNF